MSQDAVTMASSDRRQQALRSYGLLWCLGLYLRLTVLVVPPLIPQLKAVLGFASGEVAIATSLPLVTLALGGLAAGWLLARVGVLSSMLLGLPLMLWLPGRHVVWAAGLFGFFTSALFIFVLALPAWLVRVEALPRLMGGMLFFGYLLVFVITVIGGGLYDLSGVVALAFLPTLAISLAAMASTRRLLASRQREA